MSDLISRKALHEAMSYALYSSIRLDVSDIRDIINNQPTAYDVDKVVEKLQNQVERNIAPSADTKENNLMLHDRNFGIHQAIEIVKGGGVDE